MKKIFATMAAALAFSVQAFAQQDMMLTQELFSRISKNPAGTGNSDAIDAFLHGRYQWAGVDNSPKTFVLNVVDYEEDLKSGFGITAAYDKFGVGHSNTTAKVVYSYQVDLSPNTILSLGLAGGANISYFNFGEVEVDDNKDGEALLFEKESYTKVSPDFDLGAEISQLHWTIGASMTHIPNSEGENQLAPRHVYLYGTGLVPVKENLDLSPAICFMHRNQTNVLEIGSLAYFHRSYWGGLAWRPDLNNGCNPSTMAFTLGFELNNFRFGYSYDLQLGSNNHLPANTHEVILSTSFKKKWEKDNKKVKK